MRLLERWNLWRVRPGIKLAARLAEQAAWSHKSSSRLGPEQNLMLFSQRLHGSLIDADNGDIRGLCLSPMTPLEIARMRR